jgi:hypothetical protein
MLAHLRTCEDCYEIFAGAAASLDEITAADEAALLPFRPAGAAGPPQIAPGGSRRPARGPRRWRFAVAIAAPIAALLLATLGVIAFSRRNPAAGLSSNRLAAQLGQPAGTTDPWGRRLRGAGEGTTTLPPALESFQLGVRQLDLRMALAAGDQNGTDTAAARLSRLFSQMDLPPPDTVARYAGLAAALKRRTEPSGAAGSPDRQSLLVKADDLERTGFVDAVEPEFAALGRWTEACRLSAKAGRDEVFRTRDTARLLDWVLAPDLDTAVPANPAAAATTRADRLAVAEAPPILRGIRQEVTGLATGAPGASPRFVTQLGGQCKSLLGYLDPD